MRKLCPLKRGQIMYGCIMFLPHDIINMVFIPFIIALLTSTVLALIFCPVSYWLSWLKIGVVERNSIILGIMISLGSVIVLTAWGLWSDDLGAGEEIMKQIMTYNHFFMVVLITAFALINAFIEEFIYRGIAQEAIYKAIPNPYFAIFLATTCFAAAHVRYGFPNGKLGYAMTLIYGSLLGYLRFTTKGILMPYLTHVISDIVVGCFLFFSAK